MSFGFSVGDFLAVGRLIHDITSALRGSRAEYQELVRELESLARALYHVDHLKGPPSQTVAIDHIKCAALMCRQPLEDFHRKIQKFERHLGIGNSREMLKDAAKKAQWAFGLGKNDEVGRLRSYLNIHIGVINMQLVQYGFEKADIASEERAADHQALKNSMDESVREVKGVRGSIQAQALMVKENNSMIRTLLDMVGGDIGAPLKALTGVIAKVCASTQQIYNIALEIHASTRGIDTRFTYFQYPVKVEDVLGRVFPFPAEFSIAALDAEIVDRFKVGPGKLQVAAGHYEIFNARNANELLGNNSDSLLRPGMSVSMSIILDRRTKEDNRCPVPHCQSIHVFDTRGGKFCPDCDTWFKHSGKKRKREVDAPSPLDDPEDRKKLKSSKQPFQFHETQSTDVSAKNESNTELNSATSNMGAFKRISFVPKSIRCYFHLLGCYEEFNTTHEEEWMQHSLAHLMMPSFGKAVLVQPPKHSRCIFCGAEFAALRSYLCWRERMHHFLHHHEDEYSRARIDFTFVEHLWEEGFLPPELYRELKSVRVSPPTSLSLDDEDEPMAIQKTYRYPTTPQKPPYYARGSAIASPSIYSLIEHPPNSIPASAFAQPLRRKDNIKAPSSPRLHLYYYIYNSSSPSTSYIGK